MSDNADELEPTIFSATITPHRSLGSTGFLVLMLAFGGVSFFTGIAFLMMGAWPVFGFFGLDVALLYWAIRINNRRAAALRGNDRHRRRRSPCARSAIAAESTNGCSTRFGSSSTSETIEDFGINRLFLVTRGKQLTIANFLARMKKPSFATAAWPRAERGQARPDAALF